MQQGNLSLAWRQMLGVFVLVVLAGIVSALVLDSALRPIDRSMTAVKRSVAAIEAAVTAADSASAERAAEAVDRLARIELRIEKELRGLEERIATASTPDLAQKLAAETATAIGARLTRDGRVALYGIFFDFEDAQLRPESGEVVGEIAIILQQNPSLQLAVVGHTDNTGSHEHNMSLSRERAEAVIRALTEQHGIEADRLLGAGAGFLVPVASNETKVGRALNRRVELVQTDR